MRVGLPCRWLTASGMDGPIFGEFQGSMEVETKSGRKIEAVLFLAKSPEVCEYRILPSVLYCSKPFEVTAQEATLSKKSEKQILVELVRKD